MLILIADSHLSENTDSLDDFNKLLKHIANSQYDICFLGDIMELWIATAKFENEMQRNFLDWCRQQSKRRKVYMLEGNHEFFVAKRHADCFSGSSPDCLESELGLFCHGDLIQRQQSNHLLFRKISKSTFCFFLLRVLPGARSLVAMIQKRMRKKSQSYNKHLPLTEIHHWLNEKEELRGKNIFLGHFHQEHQEELSDGTRLFCLPAWKERQEIAVFDPTTEKCSFRNWREVFAN